ncbi:hypothetical protein UFOVP1192_20 [uncultured Caudovirales phage]|uniref:Uncharacterized protein n=1 Tax=uncultured Caudovirales phage TaxID=2100421 RepID=A0A6J5QZP9_9CAUD|nr:hypothetical protein UFOVP1192_20 [uncultured Caudovirales phage]
MLNTMEDMWRMVNIANACIKDLESTLNRSRKQGASLALAHLDEIDELKRKNEALTISHIKVVGYLTEIESLKRKNAMQEQGLRCMSDTISWMTDNQRIF